MASESRGPSAMTPVSDWTDIGNGWKAKWVATKPTFSGGRMVQNTEPVYMPPGMSETADFKGYTSDQMNTAGTGGLWSDKAGTYVWDANGMRPGISGKSSTGAPVYSWTKQLAPGEEIPSNEGGLGGFLGDLTKIGSLAVIAAAGGYAAMGAGAGAGGAAGMGGSPVAALGVPPIEAGILPGAFAAAPGAGLADVAGLAAAEAAAGLGSGAGGAAGGLGAGALGAGELAGAGGLGAGAGAIDAGAMSLAGGGAAAGGGGLLAGGAGAAGGGILSALGSGASAVGNALTSPAGIIIESQLAGSLLSNDANREATNTAIDAQTNASDKALALQEEMYDKGIALNQPFYDAGVAALPTLQSAVTGQPVNGVMYDHTLSPVAKYASEQGGIDLMRALGNRGLAGSGLAPVKLAELKSGIYAGDYDKQIARLSGLVDMARGTSSTLSTLGQNYGNNASNININTGENVGNAAIAQGNNRASLYQGLAGIPMDLATLSAYSRGGGLNFSGWGGN